MRKTKWHFVRDYDIVPRGLVAVMCGKTVDTARVKVKFGPSVIDGDSANECADCLAAYNRRIRRFREQA